MKKLIISFLTLFLMIITSSVAVFANDVLDYPISYLSDCPVGYTTNLEEIPAKRMTKNFTIEMWVKPGTTQETYANILDFNHRANIGMVIQQNGDETNNFSFYLGNGSTSAGIAYQLQADTWQHIAFEREGTELRLYVNCILVATAPCFQEDVYYIEHSEATIKYNTNYGRVFNGAIKGLKFWDYARSPIRLSAETMNGTVFNFNGSIDGVNLGQGIVPNMKKNFSISMDLRCRSTQQAYANIIDLNHRGNVGLVIQQDGDNINKFGFGIGNGSTSSFLSYQFSADRWYNVKLERLGTSLNLYVDKTLVATTPCFAEDVYYDLNSSATLGYNANYGRYFNGIIYNLRFTYN